MDEALAIELLNQSQEQTDEDNAKETDDLGQTQQLNALHEQQVEVPDDEPEQTMDEVLEVQDEFTELCEDEADATQDGAVHDSAGTVEAAGESDVTMTTAEDEAESLEDEWARLLEEDAKAQQRGPLGGEKG